MTEMTKYSKYHAGADAPFPGPDAVGIAIGDPELVSYDGIDDIQAPVHAIPTEAEAMSAVRTLLAYAGDDPNREGLLETPARVARAYRDWFSGYWQDPAAILSKTFSEVEGYDEIVVLKDIPFLSHCEHHAAPIRGIAHVGYLPDRRVVGISKLARVVDAFGRRFQIQEKMTQQIAQTIWTELKPRAVGVILNGEHGCIATRGINKVGVGMVTSAMLGAFRENSAARGEFLRLCGL